MANLRIPRLPARASVRVRVSMAACALVAAAVLASMPASSPGASSNVVVTFNVASATYLDVAACTSSSAALGFGTVLPGATAVTSAPCNISWGSTNDTSSLRATQLDARGNAMYPLPNHELDPTWNGDGMDAGDYFAGAEQPKSIAVAVDGSVYMVGDHGVATDSGAIAAFNPDGTLDTSFSGDGLASWQVNAGSNTWPRGVAVLGDGRIAVSMHVQGPPWGNEAAVSVFHPDGTLDTTFDGDGTRLLNCENVSTDAVRIAIDSQGRIVVVGAFNNGTGHFAVMRLLPTGVQDTTFDGDGCSRFLPVSGGSFNRLHDVDTDASDRVVSCGRVTSGIDRTLITRHTASGTLDSTFSGDGQLELPSGQDIDSCRIRVLADGDILIAVRGNPANDRIYVARITPAGVLDVAFAGDGDAIFMPIGWVGSILEEPTGDIVLLGDDGVQNVGLRITANGTDTGTFPPTRFGPTGSWVEDAAFDSDGDIVTASQGGNVWNSIRIGRAPIPQFSGAWAGGGFGACLETLGAGASPGGAPWNVAGSGNCTIAATANWHAIPAVTGASARLGATAAPGTTTAAVRFGVSVPSAAKPGRYIAPVQFEVLAPG